MKSLKTSCYTVLTLILITSNLQCSSSKYALQEQSPLNPHNTYYQEWHAGIKVGGTGINIFFPNLNGDNSVVMDSVYFRRMKGKLLKGRAMYSAILKRPSKDYKSVSVYYKDDKKLNKEANFPFKIEHNQCVISYIEKGETKYLKINNITEKESVYYKEGHPGVLNSKK